MPATAPSIRSRPRIAYLITNSEIGGAQSHVGDLLRALRDRTDAIVLAGGDGPLFAAADAVGAKAVVLKRLDNALSAWSAVAAFREVLRELRAARPDLIHVHSAKASALGRLAGWCLHVPVIYTVHGFAFKPAAPLARRLAAGLTEWCLAPLTTRLICVAQAERALAASLPIPARHIEVIRNGIPDTVLRANPGAPLRRIVMVARLKAPKRPDLLIRAFVEADIVDCELIIAGEGPDMDALQTLVTRVASGRRVTLCGPVVDIPALLASAQAFALVSDHEGLPLSILEAMRAGLPVIASDLPGIREQLDNGDGCLVPDNNVATLASAIRKVAASPELRSTLGARARARWAQDFRLDRMADATWQIYQDVLAGDPSDVHAAGSEGA
ncbi:MULTISPECIES: glycosyltransferase family 4 protein [unclassified Cupriavidus]|uniref:glycosyltransferase family 4 protein n=1 Tax=unclassified Cupriavidus TaxID=2640874 RepID=UPI001C001400|nr:MULTISPECIES: glycosyltransferase family 4 protein [unclassified Cupriavidus]MCA3184624.1 glycosyltransferase family 4 protein [Cupriavidus sp.]MCA3192828.1 glycosyltransferase family 4 protein [Cupriavidus sp.]MCA3195029.1 glycosyltransferase family 4 protein [Cupriavidus sp.]MCA3203999.1 glycosyltransferase family 4 protein [Cupriavidus sp.]MCA3206186.1 glycosyltransferase family 4 protein [Cupriavidus sp.]